MIQGATNRCVFIMVLDVNGLSISLTSISEEFKQVFTANYNNYPTRDESSDPILDDTEACGACNITRRRWSGGQSIVCRALRAMMLLMLKLPLAAVASGKLPSKLMMTS